MAGSQEVTDKQQANADPPTETNSQLYASADLSTNPVPRTDTVSNPTMDALEFKAPDFRAPTDVAAAPAVPPEKSQEATDVANLFAAVAKGDQAQIIALQTKLLGSNNSYEGSYMGQNFRLSREKYNEKTHKIYSEAQYFYSGKDLVTRTNVRRDETKRETQSSGNIVSVARNHYAPGSDTSVAAGNVTDGKFLNADDQRNKKGAFVQSLLPKGQENIKQLVAKAQTAGGADVRLGKGANAFEAKVNLTGDGTVSSVVGKTPLEPARPPTETKVEVTQPQTQPGQIEAFLKENKDNKARELVGSISSGDAATQAKAIRQLVDGGVRTLSFTRPGSGERPQELSFVPNKNGSIAVKLDGQMLGRVSGDGRIGPAMLSQNLKNLGLESNGTVNIGIKGKDQKIELGKSPVAATPDVITKPEPLTQRVESPAIQSQKLQELAAKFGTQGYSQVTQAFKPGDVIASVKPDGNAAIATLKGLDAQGNLLVEDGVSKQIVKASDWSNSFNPERRNLTAVMRKLPANNNELPPVETPSKPPEPPIMTSSLLAQRADTIRDTNQIQALDKALSPFNIRISDRSIADQLGASNRFKVVLPSKLITSADQSVTNEPSLPGDIHILTPKTSETEVNRTTLGEKNPDGMVIAMTNSKGEVVRLSDGQLVDQSKYKSLSFRASSLNQAEAPLEVAVVNGRLFPAGESQVRPSASETVSLADVEGRLKSANSKFSSQGQINFNELQGRLQSMEIGTTMLLNDASEPGKRLMAVVGDAPVSPESSVRNKILYISAGNGTWSRADDLSQLPKFSNADVYKPKEKIELQGTTEPNKEFNDMFNEVQQNAFNIGSLQGDPKARERFYNAIKSGALPIDAIKRYLSESGDTQTYYLTPKQLGFFKDTYQGFAGVGIGIDKTSEGVTITAVQKNTPATKVTRVDNNQTISLNPGDTITKINGENIADKPIEQIVKSLRGNTDTSVQVEIKRQVPGTQGTFETFSVNIIRKPLSSVQTSMDESGIVQIRMNSFTETSAEDFRREIEKIKSEQGDKIKGYIFDLRSNPGGILNSSMQILSAIVPNNTSLLKIRERNSSGNPPYLNSEYRLTENGIYKVPIGGVLPDKIALQRLPNRLIDKPISVLVDDQSASASEIIALTLQDLGHPVMGMKTFGKGTVQTIIPGKNGALKITTAQFLSPVSNRWVGNAVDIRRGLEPDIVIPNQPGRIQFGSPEDKQIMEARRLMLQSMLVK